MKLNALFPATVSSTETASTQETAQCECGNQLEQKALAGARRIDDEIRLYCVNCL